MALPRRLMIRSSMTALSVPHRYCPIVLRVFSSSSMSTYNGRRNRASQIDIVNREVSDGFKTASKGREKNTNKKRIRPQRSNEANANEIPTFSLFASCLPGIEPLLYEELVTLGFHPQTPPTTTSKSSKKVQNKKTRTVAKPLKGHWTTPEAQLHSGAGGISFQVDSVESIMNCHLYLGTATHILLRCGEPFKARGMEEMRRKVSKMNFWKQYIGGNIKSLMPTLDIRVTTSKSRLYHTEGIAQRVEQGILSALGVSLEDRRNPTAVANDNDDKNNSIEKTTEQISATTINVVVRVKNDYVQISVDTSCTPLHRRGYRLEGAKSPLREDLAYSLLYGSGWPKHFTHLLDPFCGSGTILIEGAMMAAGLPPGRLRPEPLLGSSLANKGLWQRLLSKAEESSSQIKSGENTMKLFGSDRDKGAINASKANADRAGVSNHIQLKKCSIMASPWLSVPPSGPGKILIATNPPFGVRSSAKQNVFPVYRALVDGFCKMATKHPASLSILAHDINLLRKTMKADQVQDTGILFSTKHGGLSVVAMQCHQNKNR